MRCEPCDGLGHRLQRAPSATQVPGLRLVPCPHCGGTGLVSCCEGTERHAGVAGVAAPPFHGGASVIAFPRSSHARP